MISAIALNGRAVPLFFVAAFLSYEFVHDSLSLLHASVRCHSRVESNVLAYFTLQMSAVVNSIASPSVLAATRLA